MEDLPEPAHKYGYTPEQIDEIFQGEEREKFNQWMRGQTMALIDGEPVIYTWDVKRYAYFRSRGVEDPPVYD